MPLLDKKALVSDLESRMDEYVPGKTSRAVLRDLLEILDGYDVITSAQTSGGTDNSVELIELYLNAKAVEGLSPKTIAGYRGDLLRLYKDATKSFLNGRLDWRNGMIEMSGKREEIALAVKGIAPEWPVQLIEQLDLGEWHFTLNGVDVLTRITDAHDEEVNLQWIPATERLPEEPYGCLAIVWDNPRYGDGDMFLNYYPEFVGWDGETWNDADGEEIPLDVVYWMKMPQIPEPQMEGE